MPKGRKPINLNSESTKPCKLTPAEDRVGQRFGRLVVQGVRRKKNGPVTANCLCDCGNIKAVNLNCLVSGGTRSCGCLLRESAIERFTTHGKHDTPEHTAWNSMRQRCWNPKNQRYSDYGGRGIKICKRWAKFENFYEDMGPRPSNQHSLDRIDNNGNYCPENCRWATREQQIWNKRSNRLYSFNGKTQTSKQWAEETGIKEVTLKDRLYKGWSLEKALTEPVKKRTKSGK